jgi:hypothetical protein
VEGLGPRWRQACGTSSESFPAASHRGPQRPGQERESSRKQSLRASRGSHACPRAMATHSCLFLQPILLAALHLSVRQSIHPSIIHLMNIKCARFSKNKINDKKTPSIPSSIGISDKQNVLFSISVSLPCDQWWPRQRILALTVPFFFLFSFFVVLGS